MIATRRWSPASAVVVVLAVAVTACGSGGSSSSSSAAGGQTLHFVSFNPFSGADANFGPEINSGCLSAVYQINKAGGVLGNQLNCVTVDTKGDPADAVPAASRMLATTSNLVGVLGPSSDEATATVPVIGRSKVPMFADTGESVWDTNTNAYFHRLIAPDDSTGVALAAWAQKKGYKRGAAVFGSDIGAQGSVPSLMSAFPKTGGSIVINEKLTLDKSSYQTEVQQVLATHPDVIFTEADPPTAAAFFSEYQQAAGTLPPIVGTNVTVLSDWLTAVSGSVGKSQLEAALIGVQPYSPPSGPGWEGFNQGLMNAAGVTTPQTWSTNYYTMTMYDSAVLMALGMVAAGSTDPATYDPFILKVANGSTVVHTYADGVTALKAGQTIRYVGASGTINFNKYQDSLGDFEGAKYVAATGQVALADTLSPQAIRALQ
jgi:ABC-type branched-subunit amino acid transport system substrate-binding protein